MYLAGITVWLMAMAFSIVSALEHNSGEVSSPTTTILRNGTAEEGIFNYPLESIVTYPFPFITFVSGGEAFSQTTAVPTSLPAQTGFDPSQINYNTVIYTGGLTPTPGPTNVDTTFPYPATFSETIGFSSFPNLTLASQLPGTTISVKNVTQITSSFATHKTLPSQSGNSRVDTNITTGTGFTSPTAVSNTANTNSPTDVCLFVLTMVGIIGLVL